MYVYLQGRENGKVVTRYLGPLGRIVEGVVRVSGMGVVDRPGFEPGTSRMPTERSSRLSYRPTLRLEGLSHAGGCWLDGFIRFADADGEPPG